VTDVTAYSYVRHRIVPPPTIVAMILFAVAVGLLFTALETSDLPTRAVVWGSLSLASYAAGLLCLAAGIKGLAQWKFGSWSPLWCSATFGIATTTWSQPQIGSPAQIAISSILRALWLVAVGMTAWVLGYLVGPGLLARRALARGVAAVGQRFTAEVRSPAAPWILYAVGVGARVTLAVSTHRFGYVGNPTEAVGSATGYKQILSLLSYCAPFAVCAAALQTYRERLRGARITLAILFITELAFGAVAGGKENFIIVILSLIIPMSAAHYRLPKTAVIGGVLFFLVIIIPFNQTYRTSVPEGLTPRQEIANAPEILYQTLTWRKLPTAIPGSFSYLLQRLREIDNPAIILQRTGSQFPFISPIQLIERPLADAVPRAIWPDKPVLVTGYQFSQQYYGLPSTVYTSTAITPLGDLYRYGGWIPVIIGMFLIGYGMRLLDSVLDVFTNPHTITLIILLIPSLILAESDWATTLAGLPATAFTWLLVVSLTFRRRLSR